jgi:predicted nucleic acid-binding protein
LADPPLKVYWDSCAWIGLVNAEADKLHPLRAIWEDAQKGKYEIWTSAYVHLEVFKAKNEKGDPLSPHESDERIEAMLTQPFVKRVQLDIQIAKCARDLRRSLDSLGLKSRPDAIHLATAVYWNLDELHTWDKKHLLDLNGHVDRRDGKPILIRIPGPEVMGPLFAAPEITSHG